MKKTLVISIISYLHIFTFAYCAEGAAPATAGAAHAVEFRVDAAKLPEMAQWAEKNVRRPVEKWADNVVTLLDGKDATWTNGVVELVLETGEGGNVAPAWACGGKIFLNMKWATSCPQEAAGACVHEFAHVVQDYGPRDGRAIPYANTPGWLVEGIADWVRWFNYEGKAGAKRANGYAMRNPKYDGAYNLTASFLDYVARKCKRDVIVKLNKTCREGKYDEGVWKTLTGKDLGTLDMEWKKKLGVKFRAAHDADEASRSAVWIQFHFDGPTKISGYRWYTANDFEERDPRDWRLLGSDDEANWVLVDKVEDFEATSDRKALAYTARL